MTALATCHGTFGEGEGRLPKLVGGAGTLRGDRQKPRSAVIGRLRRHCATTLTAPCRCRRHTHCQPMTFMLCPPIFRTARHDATKMSKRKTPLTDISAAKSAAFQALALALLIGAAAPASAQSAAAEGQKIAFDRGKGNCLTCHDIKGGDLPGTIGPALKDIKSKYPDRNELVAIVTDETKRNPQTVMPPFGRNRLLSEQEINAVVDFLQTL